MEVSRVMLSSGAGTPCKDRKPGSHPFPVFIFKPGRGFPVFPLTLVPFLLNQRGLVAVIATVGGCRYSFVLGSAGAGDGKAQENRGQDCENREGGVGQTSKHSPRPGRKGAT